MVTASRIAAAAVIAAGVLAVPATAQTHNANRRPHAAVWLRDRGVAIARFDAQSHRSHGLVVVHLTLTARSRPGAPRRYVLRAGACRGENTGHVTCPPSFARAVTLSPSRTTIRAVNARLHVAPGRRRAVLATLTPAASRPPSKRAAQSIVASLLLPDRAWLAYPRVRFGLRVYRPWEGEGSPFDVRSVTADAAQSSPTRLWPVLGWSLLTHRAAEVITAASACGGRPACPQHARSQTVMPGQTARYSDRPALDRSRPRVWSFSARSGDGVIFNATMPWPV